MILRQKRFSADLTEEELLEQEEKNLALYKKGKAAGLAIAGLGSIGTAGAWKLGKDQAYLEKKGMVMNPDLVAAKNQMRVVGPGMVVIGGTLYAVSASKDKKIKKLRELREIEA